MFGTSRLLLVDLLLSSKLKLLGYTVQQIHRIYISLYVRTDSSSSRDLITSVVGDVRGGDYTESERHSYKLVQACRPKFLQSSKSTPFLRDGPWNFVPLPSLSRFLFPFRNILGFLYFLGYLGLRVPTFPAKKIKQTIRKGLGGGTLIKHVCKILGSIQVYLSKSARTFRLYCGKVQKSRLRIVIAWFRYRFDFS